MDVITLDSNFNPKDIINEFETMAWTERYYESGEFELTTYNVEETMALMPIDSCISLSDQVQVMVVDSHLIEQDSNGTDVLKVSGPSLDDRLNSRWIMDRNTSTTPGATPTSYSVGSSTIHNVFATIMYDLGDTSGTTVLSGFITSPNNIDPNHTIPIFRFTGDGTSLLSIPQRYIPAQPLGNAFRAILAEDDASIYSDRTRKKLNNSPFFDPISAGQVLFVVRKRINRQEGSGNFPIIWTTDGGEIKKASYLRSVKNYRNVALFQNDIVNADLFASGAVSTDINGTLKPVIGGLTRRELYVDTVSYFRDAGLTKANAQYKAKQQALTELKKYQQTLFITAEASDAVRAGYNTQYGLGDYITFRGDYGFTSGMQITEFTFIKDAQGERAYPTLTEI